MLQILCYKTRSWLPTVLSLFCNYLMQCTDYKNKIHRTHNFCTFTAYRKFVREIRAVLTRVTIAHWSAFYYLPSCARISKTAIPSRNCLRAVGYCIDGIFAVTIHFKKDSFCCLFLHAFIFISRWNIQRLLRISKIFLHFLSLFSIYI